VDLDFLHRHWEYKHDVSKADSFLPQVKTKAVCFGNVVFVLSVTMQKVEIHIRDISHVIPLSKNYNVQLNILCKKKSENFNIKSGDKPSI
jgi:hypothetical protein